MTPRDDFSLRRGSVRVDSPELAPTAASQPTEEKTMVRRRLPLIPILILCGCASPDTGSETPLTGFAEDTPVVGRVVENVTGCEVDAACWLRIELADTTILAFYGLGDRDDAPCRIPRAVSDAAFDVRRGDTVEVVLSPCGAEGHFIRDFVSPGARSGASALALPELRAELLAMRDEDQRMRRELVRQMNSEEGVDSVFGARVVAMDERNTARLGEILDEHGWPGWSLVGQEGARAAWVLAQHADRDPDFQRRALSLLGAAVDQGEASGENLAFLTDRVRRAEGRPQLYGTQTRIVDCARVPYPIQDPEMVDARRAEVGLGPIVEYLELRRRQLGVGPGCDG